MRKLKLLVVLIMAGVIGLTGYAYLGDMSPDRREVRSPLALDQGAAPAPDGPGPDSPAAETAEADAPPAGAADD